MPALQVRRRAYALGADVTGVDLRNTLDDETVTAIREAWLEHLLLCFPDQDVDRHQLLAFAQRFGELEPVFMNADPDAVGITLLTHKAVNGQAWDGYKNGHNWHSDQSFTTQPTLATFIAAKEVPQAGGDTMFANLYRAYDTLSPALQGILDGLSAVHVQTLRHRGLYQGLNTIDKEAAARISRDERERSAGKLPTVHPVVLVHPETGRRALFLGDRARQFVGMTENESAPLLDFLNGHAVAYEFTYRHRWSANDVVMWDNRCLLHIALCDYDVQHDVRHMYRCAVRGPRMGYPLSPEDADLGRSKVTAG